jgi:kanamycin kinase
MIRKPVTPPWDVIPPQFHGFLQDAAVFDSSCSAVAQVWFLDKGPGYYLKRSPAGSLRKEVDMTRFFHEKGLGPQVLDYAQLEQDWMLTVRVPGEDCIDAQYMADPLRLCDTTAQLLRMLHETDASGCPVHRTADYLETARKNYEAKAYDLALFPDNWGYASPEEAWQEIERNGKFLRSDTLLHGDYCLPNIMLDHWQFSGFIDLDAGGLGDRHIDLFWGIWSLQFNLKTDRYRERFLDAYGRESVCEDVFRTVAACEVFG